MVQLKENYADFKEGITRFQFLMVQLKVCLLNPDVACRLISIPYGSIKSGWSETMFSLINKFQFLMVQLKECVFPDAPFCFFYFNSLWFN